MSALLEVYRQVGRVGGSTARRVRSWPSDAYLGDPVGFAIEQLGRAPTKDQALVMNGIVRNRKTTTRAGRRTGKSETCGMMGAYVFCTYPEATVFLGGPCLRQIDEIVYHSLTGILTDQRCLSCRILHPERTGQCCEHVTPIDCDIAASASHGIRSADGRRRIFGAAPRDAQSARGIAAQGKGMIALLDEMSGIPRDVYEVMSANVLASGGKLALFGNPAVLHDAFWESFFAGEWARFVMSSLNVPNVLLRKIVVDGLADYEWTDECLQVWGPDDARYFVDILGEFPNRTMLELISDVALADAFARFERIEDLTQVRGDLWLGIDPAGGTGNDDSVIYIRRGPIVLECQAFQGATGEIMNRTVALLRKYRVSAHERVDINFDDSSRMGRDLADAIRAEAITDPNIHWNALNSRGTFIDRNSPLHGYGYARPRDAYWGNMCLRLGKDVSIPFDQELRQEILAAEWMLRDDNLKRMIDKRVHMKKLGGRSPDRGDALAYCLFEGRLETLSEFTANAMAAQEAAEARLPPPPDPSATKHAVMRKLMRGHFS